MTIYVTPEQAENAQIQHCNHCQGLQSILFPVKDEAVSVGVYSSDPGYSHRVSLISLPDFCQCHSTTDKKSGRGLCAKEGCAQPIYTQNALALQSEVGPLIMYLCAEHLAQAIHTNLTTNHLSPASAQQRITELEDFIYDCNRFLRSMVGADLAEYDAREKLIVRASDLFEDKRDYPVTFMQNDKAGS